MATLCSEENISVRRHNAANDRGRQAMKELRRRGPEAEALFVPLLKHEVDGVRVAAAYFLLPVRPQEACETLEEISKNPQSWKSGLSASTMLDLYRNGELSMI